MLVAVAGPRANTQLQTNAVRQLIARTPADAKVIEASIPYSQAEPVQHSLVGPARSPESARSCGICSGSFRCRLLRPTWRRSRPHSPGRGFRAKPAWPGRRQVELIYSSHLSGNVRLIRGKLPSAGQLTPKGVQGHVPDRCHRGDGASVRALRRVPAARSGHSGHAAVTGIIQPVVADQRVLGARPD